MCSMTISFSECSITTPRKQCVFPFKYKEKSYTSCTSDHSHRDWCSTLNNADGTVKEYGYCDTNKCKKGEFYYEGPNFTYNLCFIKVYFPYII